LPHEALLRATWYRDGDIVSAPFDPFDLPSLQVVADVDGTRGSVAAFDLAEAASGRLALVWPDASESLVDLHYSVYDDTDAVWTKPRPLTEDGAEERDVTAAIAPDGSLAAAYTKVLLGMTTETVDFGGEMIVLDNVPTVANLDLYALRHTIELDVGIDAADIALAPAVPGPGDAVTLTATIRNLGDTPVTALEVEFYDGDPALSGTLIDTLQTIPGVLAGGESADVSVPYTIPVDGMVHEIFVVVDPAMLLPDIEPSNNVASIPATRAELEVEALWSTAPSECTREVFVTARNTGAVATGPFDVSLRANAVDGSSIATIPVADLAPGANQLSSVVWSTPEPDPQGALPSVFGIADEADAVLEYDELDNARFIFLDMNPGLGPDCNQNQFVDSCDLSLGYSVDCNVNSVPDECEIDEQSPAPGGPWFCTMTCDPDCNDNGIPDECEADCNTNLVPDECDIGFGTSLDCQPNLVPDECDIASGPSLDCQPNGVPDECDIASGTSQDLDMNGIPDECP
jgi:hypothetical protein